MNLIQATVILAKEVSAKKMPPQDCAVGKFGFFFFLINNCCRVHLIVDSEPFDSVLGPCKTEFCRRNEQASKQHSFKAFASNIASMFLLDFFK